MKTERRGESFYVVYCDTGNCYLSNSTSLLSVVSRENVGKTVGMPILIFDEDSVWYPLMERDDTATSPTLSAVVWRFVTQQVSLKMTEFEKEAVGVLRNVTRLNEEQRLMAMLAASHNEDIGTRYVRYNEFERIWSRLRLPFRINGFLQEIYSIASRLSPISAYLAQIANQNTGEEKVRSICNEYSSHAGDRNLRYGMFSHGHTWSCGLVGQTIDESYRTKAGHCVWQSSNLASVLHILGLDYFILEGLDTISGGFHTTVYVEEYGLVFSDGHMESHRNTVLSHEAAQGKAFSPIKYVSYKGKWAFPQLGRYYGTLSPSELTEILQRLQSLHKDDIKGLRGDYLNKDVISFAELIEGLRTTSWNQVSIP